jgi:hypothetical protein
MLILILFQSVLLAAVIAAVIIWRIQFSARLREIQTCAAWSLSSEQRLQAAILRLQLQLDEWRESHSQKAQDPLPSVPPLAASTAPPEAAPVLTITKRSQALRMIRRGDQPETVSAALGIPNSHIRLLIKVQEMIQPPGVSR